MRTMFEQCLLMTHHTHQQVALMISRYRKSFERSGSYSADFMQKLSLSIPS